MSNYDGRIDEGFAKALQAEPGKVYGSHFGWNFCGRVYFYKGLFTEEVWVLQRPLETISAPTLHELKDKVNERYGND